MIGAGSDSSDEEKKEESSEESSEEEAEEGAIRTLSLIRYKWWLARDDKHYFLQNHAKVGPFVLFVNHVCIYSNVWGSRCVPTFLSCHIAGCIFNIT